MLKSKRSSMMKYQFKLMQLTFLIGFLHYQSTTILLLNHRIMKHKVTYFNIFGCVSYVHVPSKKGLKLDDDSVLKMMSWERIHWCMHGIQNCGTPNILFSLMNTQELMLPLILVFIDILY